MARTGLLSVALLTLLATSGTRIISQVPNAEVPSWVKDMSTLEYPSHPSENFSKTFGVPPTKLTFADSEHLVVTFISSDPGTPSEREGRPDSFKLRLHIVVFESKTGEIDMKRDWPTPNPNDGVVAGHDGKVIVRTGDKLTLYVMALETLKERDTAPNHKPNEGLFKVFTSPTGHFLLLEFLRGNGREYGWMDADNLETVHSFSDSNFALSISDKEIIESRVTAPHGAEFVIRNPDELGRTISNGGTFVNQDTLVIEAGYSPMLLMRTDGTLLETISPHPHDFFSRVTPSAEGHRLAFTGSSIRNISEILYPHQQWEYVQRVIVYDIPTHIFLCDVKVKHSTRNQDFALALSPSGSTLAFLDGESLKVYRLPPTTEHRP